MAISIKGPTDIGFMREAGEVIARTHVVVQAAVAPGVRTSELDAIARDTIADAGAIASFYGHHGFTGHICASVNEEIVHGIPGPRILRDGDIISVDIGAIVQGWHGDSAWTYPVGSVSPDAERLLRDTETSLYLAVEQAVAGNRLGDIGWAIEKFANEHGYGLVRGYGGHGIGRKMWEEPHVANEGPPHTRTVLRPGMTLAIEPMLNVGRGETVALDDGWTVVTEDASISAHFEHTVVITDGPPEILTKRLAAVVQ